MRTNQPASRPLSFSLLATLTLLSAPCALAEDTNATHTEAQPSQVINTAPVVVTATRQQQNSFDLPLSIDSVSAEQIQDGQLQVNVSESLARVPGIVAQFRGQYAQDLQVSTRGFGARSQFGVRGIRLYSDGIPLTMPDGQGQTGTMDPGSARSIEVMRGPFSALYGNSSGGVMQIFTADGPKDPTVQTSYTTGSYDTQREAVKVGGTAGAVNYNADLSHLESDDYRQHAAVRRTLFNTKVGVQLNQDTQLTLLGTYLDQPEAQDPLSLTQAQWKANPKQANPNAYLFNTRVERRHTQVGARIEHNLDEDNLISIMAYGGSRFNLQYQSIPIAAQVPSGSSGGVAQINRNFGGGDVRFTHKGLLAGGAYSVSLGANYDSVTDDRTGYTNYIQVASGPTLTCGKTAQCGVKGALKRDEKDSSWNFDQYAQAEWSPTERWNLLTGVRHSSVTLKSNDKYVVTGNKDDSGSVTYQKTTPVAGVLFKLTPSVNLYANAGKGFETPTLVEMAYSPDGGGFNLNLKPSTSYNYEVGAKAFLGMHTRANLALFHIKTDDEIVVANSNNGRSSYQNAGSTRREGFEFSVDSEFGAGFTGYASYAYLNAEYTDPYCSGKVTSNKAQCSGPSVAWVNSGKDLPGTYSRTAYAELAWKYAPMGFSTALEGRAMSKVYVADTNNDSAPGFGTMSWRGGFNQSIRSWKIAEFVRVDNLFDRHVIGSVKINDSNKQYFEPAANRNWLLGLSASYQF